VCILYQVGTQRFAKNILVLDDDLGFVMWLGRILTEAGFLAMPASTSQEATAIVEECRFPKVDLLIANFELAGSRDLVQKLGSLGKKFRLIGIGEAVAAGAGRRKIRATLDRPRGRSPLSPERYLETVRRVLQ